MKHEIVNKVSNRHMLKLIAFIVMTTFSRITHAVVLSNDQADSLKLSCLYDYL